MFGAGDAEAEARDGLVALVAFGEVGPHRIGATDQRSAQGEEEVSAARLDPFGHVAAEVEEPQRVRRPLVDVREMRTRKRPVSIVDIDRADVGSGGRGGPPLLGRWQEIGFGRPARHAPRSAHKCRVFEARRVVDAVPGVALRRPQLGASRVRPPVGQPVAVARAGRPRHAGRGLLHVARLDRVGPGAIRPTGPHDAAPEVIRHERIPQAAHVARARDGVEEGAVLGVGHLGSLQLDRAPRDRDGNPVRPEEHAGGDERSRERGEAGHARPPSRRPNFERTFSATFARSSRASTRHQASGTNVSVTAANVGSIRSQW